MGEEGGAVGNGFVPGLCLLIVGTDAYREKEKK
jgi:hypothetical protein